MPRTRPDWYAPGGWPAAWVLVPTGTTPAAVPGRPCPATPPPAAPVPHSASSLTPGYLCVTPSPSRIRRSFLSLPEVICKSMPAKARSKRRRVYCECPSVEELSYSLIFRALLWRKDIQIESKWVKFILMLTHENKPSVAHTPHGYCNRLPYNGVC